MIIAMIAIYLGLFNLLPLPGLDGGRLMFLGWEAVSRRRVNERIEQTIHMVGVLVLLALIVVISVQERHHLSQLLPPLMRKRPGPAGRRARRPSSELPGDTKEQILAVAEELFAQKGFAGVRTHEIAERAGVNKAMIYYWYQSKEQLLRAVLQKILFELIALSQEILARKLPPVEVLEEFYRGFFYYTARHRNFSRLTTMDLGSEGGYLRTMFESFFRPLFERGVRFIDAGRRARRAQAGQRAAAAHHRLRHDDRVLRRRQPGGAALRRRRTRSTTSCSRSASGPTSTSSSPPSGTNAARAKSR